MANAFSTVPAGWWEDGSTVTGTELRRGQLPSLVAGGTTPMGVRGGVRPARGNPLGVTLPGGMFIRAQAGVCAVPGPDTEGAYVMSNPATLDLAVTAANSTNPRIDVFGAEVVPGSPTTWRFRMLDGTPAVTPTVPTYAVAGGFFLPLAQIRTNANATVPTTVTDVRQYSVAAGGTVPFPGLMALSSAARAAVCAGLPAGTGLYDTAADVFGVVRNDGTFKPVVGGRLTGRQADFQDYTIIWGVSGSTYDGANPVVFNNLSNGQLIDVQLQATLKLDAAGAQTVHLTPGGSGFIPSLGNGQPQRFENVSTSGADWRQVHFATTVYASGGTASIVPHILIGSGGNVTVVESQIWAQVDYLNT